MMGRHIIDTHNVLRKYNIYCVSKNDTDVAHYNFNAHQPILVICGRDLAETVCHQMVLCHPNSLN